MYTCVHGEKQRDDECGADARSYIVPATVTFCVSYSLSSILLTHSLDYFPCELPDAGPGGRGAWGPGPFQRLTKD